MSDICVAYWSGTGNTEAMAQAIGAGITAAGKSADVVPMETISPADLKDQAVWVLGCPAMGAEELEDGTVEPFVSELEGFASGKKVALFGSYDWGDGEWMRSWEERVASSGAKLIDSEGLIINETPDDDALEQCRELGKKAAAL
mgnify:CR=1 FL=1